MIYIIELNKDDFDDKHRIELELNILGEKENFLERTVSYTLQLNAKEMVGINEVLVENSAIKRIDVSKDLIVANQDKTSVNFRVQQEKATSKWSLEALLFGREEHSLQVILLSENATSNPVFLDTILTNRDYEHIVYEGFTKVSNIPELNESVQSIVYEGFNSTNIHRHILSNTMSFDSDLKVMKAKDFQTRAKQTGVVGADFSIQIKVAPEELKETKGGSIFKVILDGIGEIEIHPREIRFRIEGDSEQSYLSEPFLSVLDTSILYKEGRFATNASLKIEGNRNRDMKITYNNYDLDVRYKMGAKLGNLVFIGGRISKDSEYEGSLETIEINHRIASRIADLSMQFTK